MNCKYLYFTEKDLAQRWKNVKDNFWEDTKKETLMMVKYLMEGTLNEEMAMYARAGRHERTKERTDYRNGYYNRDLVTEIGLIKDIIVPRCRKKGFKSKIFKRYQRRQENVNKGIQDIFIAGVSTRRVEEVLQPLLGMNVSAGTVSNIAKELNRKVEVFHKREIGDEYIYLFLDGIYMSVKSALEARKRPILVAYGIKANGERELVNFRLARKESARDWEAFLNDMYNRGLKGRNLKLIITDGCPGLLSVIDVVYPYARRQRCWVHKMRNVSNYLPKKYQKDCIAGARRIYLSSNQREAVKEFHKWAKRWRDIVPKAVKCIEKDIDELLNFLDFPEEHRKKIRTTNVIERSFREIRRRVRTMGCFSNSDSCNRIVYALVFYLNNKWQGQKNWLKEFGKAA